MPNETVEKWCTICQQNTIHMKIAGNIECLRCNHVWQNPDPNFISIKNNEFTYTANLKLINSQVLENTKKVFFQEPYNGILPSGITVYMNYEHTHKFDSIIFGILQEENKNE